MSHNVQHAWLQFRKLVSTLFDVVLMSFKTFLLQLYGKTRSAIVSVQPNKVNTYEFTESHVFSKCVFQTQKQKLQYWAAPWNFTVWADICKNPKSKTYKLNFKLLSKSASMQAIHYLCMHIIGVCTYDCICHERAIHHVHKHTLWHVLWSTVYIVLIL